MSDPAKAIFLSYASQDAAAAQRICEALQAAGMEVWFDRSELRGGEAWDASIRRQIKACALFVALISRTTQSRDEGYFRLEWKLAVDRSHLMAPNRPFLLPVAIDDAREDDNVPERFREVQWMRLAPGPVPAEFAERIRRLLAGEAAQARTAGAAPPASPETAVVAASRWTWLKVTAAFVAATLLASVIGYYATLPADSHRSTTTPSPPPTHPAP